LASLRPSRSWRPRRRPAAPAQGSPADDAILLEEGTAFILKPWADDTGVSGYRFRMAIGDTCVVTAEGARRLSARALELAEIDC
jgi:hypothetical protein